MKDDLDEILAAPAEVFWTLVYMDVHAENERVARNERARLLAWYTRRRHAEQRRFLERLLRDRVPSQWGDYRTPLQLRKLARGLRRALRRDAHLV